MAVWPGRRRGRWTAAVALAALTLCLAAESASARVVQVIGTTGDLRLRSPTDADLGPTGEVHVLDTADRAASAVLMKVYSPGGSLVRSWSVGRLQEQGGTPFMALDAAGNAYVGASGIKGIQKYSSSGQRLTVWPIGAGERDYPVSLAVDPTGNIVVAEANGRIETFHPTGRLLASRQGHADSVAVTTSGIVYVADEKGIARLDAAGNVAVRLVPTGRRPGQVLGPRLITGPADSVYAVERDRIQKFGPQGEFLGSVGLDRRAVQPTGAAVAGDGTIYVPQWLAGRRSPALLKLAPITTVDATPPSIRVDSIFSPSIARGTATPRTGVLARLTYRLSEAGSFRVTLKRRASTTDRGSPSFGRYLYKATVDIALTAAGKHVLVLKWRSFFYEHPLAGRYQLTIVSRDDAGNESPPARVTFAAHRR